MPVRLFEGFPYNGERELLELRMRELAGVVDGFALVQSDRNFRGEPRKFPAPSGLVRDYTGLKVFALHPPPGPHPTTDYYQRSQIGKALMAFKPQIGDLLMLSDLDEIPNPDVLSRLKITPPKVAMTLIQHLYYYSPSWLQAQPWAGSIVWPHKGVAYDTQEIRDRRGQHPQIANGGWHFSYFGPPARIASKIRDLDIARDAFEGGETDRVTPPDPEDLDFIADCRITGRDLLKRTDAIFQKRHVELDPGGLHPHLIREWLTMYPDFA